MPRSSANQCKSTLPKVGSKPRKPSRRTLLRIRYYEMKIRLSDMYVGIRYFFTKSKLAKYQEGRKTSCNNESTECPNEDDNSMKETSEGETTKLHRELEGSVKVNREGRSSTTDVKQKSPRRRKRRSSLTRRNSEAERVVSTRSFASGDVNFSDCDEDELKSSKLKIKKNRRSKTDKLIKVKSDGEVASSLENIDPKDNDKMIEDTNSHKTGESSQISPLPFQIPTTNLQAKLQKAYSAAETKIKTPKKSLKQRFAELSNRKRPRDVTQAPPNLFKMGVEANLLKGTVRRRKGVYRQDDPEITTPKSNLITSNANLQGGIGITSPPSFLVDVNNQNYSYPNRFILKDDINKSTPEKAEGKFATILKQFSNFRGLSSTSKPLQVDVDSANNYPANFSNPYDQIHNATASFSIPQTFRAAKDVRESITNHYDIFPKYDPLMSRYFRFTDDKDLPSDELSGPGISRSLDIGTGTSRVESYKPKTQFTSQFYNLLAPDSFS